jgi:hypothetical protein
MACQQSMKLHHQQNITAVDSGSIVWRATEQAGLHSAFF